MLKNIINIFLFFALGTISHDLHAQLLENSLFKIYRSEFIAGTVTQFRLNSDSTYYIKVIEIHCSLCDQKQLTKMIHSKGKWIQRNDTILIESGKKLLIINDSLIRPLFLMGINLDSVPSDKAYKYREHIIKGKTQDFHLVYDTYPDGVAKLIEDKHRMRRDEYEIELKPNGTINSVKYYWDNKRKKRIK